MARTKTKEREEEVQEERKPQSSRRTSSRRGSGSRSQQQQRKGSKSKNVVIRYLQDTNDELKKVTWPTQEQTLRLSVIVLVSAIAATLFLWLFDLAFQQLIALLI